ncbi:MAG TPA: M48 family metallopeptidase [Verrucomicrobiae bacterium]|nr:M48 family metallopeptidase [Verrucomicrobiae bacterium]
MTRQEFDACVKEIEKRYANKPRALQRRVLYWALVGYAGFFAWIAGVGLMAGALFIFGLQNGIDGLIFFIAALLVLAVGGWWVGRALWIRLPKPEGRKVTKKETPRLFACLEEVRAKCGSAGFHSVLITREFNAGVAHIPRLGLLGWPRHYLMIGLPLLDLLSEAEMTAVLAHEFAHLSKEHTRFGHWIYRLRLSWDFLFTQYLNRPQFEGEISSRALLRKYVSWFWPYFNAHAFVLSRAHEYDADSVAASITGSRAIAAALARIRACAEVIDEKFWPELWQQAVTTPEPPSDPLEQLASFVRTHFQTFRPELLDRALRTITTNHDTHPCLRERLANLQFNEPSSLTTALLSLPASQSAATSLLGPALESIRKDVNGAWRKDCLDTWKKRFDRGISLDHHIQTVEKSLSNRLDAETLWEKARSIIDAKSDAAAEPLLRQILELLPSHSKANFRLGRKLLADDKMEGVAHIERAISEDKELLHHGYSLLFAFYRSRGETANVEAIRRRVDEHEAMLKASAAEIQTVSSADKVIAHGLDAIQLASLIESLRAFPDVARVYLGRKELKVLKEEKLFLLCIRARRQWHRFPNTSAEEQIVAKMTMMSALPGRTFTFAASGPFKDVAKKLMKFPGTLIFSNDA